jgi:hypothetical protein
MIVKKIFVSQSKSIYDKDSVPGSYIKQEPIKNMNEEAAKKLIKTAYEQIRVVKLIQKGYRSPTLLAKRMGWVNRQKAHYYIKLLT